MTNTLTEKQKAELVTRGAVRLRSDTTSTVQEREVMTEILDLPNHSKATLYDAIHEVGYYAKISPPIENQDDASPI